MSAIRKILWAGNVREHPIPDRLRAAAANGYAAIAVSPDDVQRELHAGRSYADLRNEAASTGVAIEHLDPIATWPPSWRPADDGWAGHDMITDFLAIEPDAFFAMAEALGVRSVTALGAFPQGTIPQPSLVEAFAALCDRAAALEMRVDLEFIPFWGIPDLDLAWRIVSESNRRNGAVGVDFWHYSRGNPDDELLASVPRERIGWVQVSDAAMTPRADSIIEDCLFCRVHPGDGEFRITELLQLLDRADALSLVGPEIFSREMDALPVDEAVAIADRRLEAALDEAGVSR